MSDMYVITATSVHCSDVANVMQLYMYCNSTLYNDKIHKNHRETEHMQNLHLICIVSQHYLKPATTPPAPPYHQPLQTHISRNPELLFCSNIIHYSVLYNYTVCIVHA